MSARPKLKDGDVPVNKFQDPLRKVGLLADRDAAQTVIDLAARYGMPNDHDRRTMLIFNIALERSAP